MKALKVKQVDLANALGISPEKVSKSLDDKGTRTFSPEEMDVVRQMLRQDGDPVVAEFYPSLPVIGQVQAGAWSEAVQRPEGSMVSPVSHPPRRAFGLDVVGNSMNKVAPEGTRLIIDPDDRGLFPKKFYVVLNERGETTFKQFFADPARLVPCSDDPSFSDIILGGPETFTIVGRVILRVEEM